jgi:hypothetical protein
MALEGLRSVFGTSYLKQFMPPSVREFAAKAKTLIEQEETEEAGQLLAQALERFPGHSSLEDINHFLGEEHLQENLHLLRETMEQTREAHVRTARAFAQTDKTEQTIDFIARACSVFPDCSELHLLLGETHLRRYLEDRIPEDGEQAAKSLERACGLDPKNALQWKLLAGLYARTGYFKRAALCMGMLKGRIVEEEEQRYVTELADYCVKQADHTRGRDLARCLEDVWASGEFAVDCDDWAWPKAPAFRRRDTRFLMVPFVLLESAGRKCVQFPGVKAVVAQNKVRSSTVVGSDVNLDAAMLEQIVREVVGRAGEACRLMKLGRLKQWDLTTTVGKLSVHIFVDTWAGLLFKEGVSTTQADIVTRQFLDLLAERLGEMRESNP